MPWMNLYPLQKYPRFRDIHMELWEGISWLWQTVWVALFRMFRWLQNYCYIYSSRYKDVV